MAWELFEISNSSGNFFLFFLLILFFLFGAECLRVIMIQTICFFKYINASEFIPLL